MKIEDIIPLAVIGLIGVLLGAGLMSAIMKDIIAKPGQNIDMEEHAILNTDYSHWMHFTMEAGKTDVVINTIPAGALIYDRYYHRLIFSVDTAPGGAKSCSVSLSDGTKTMSVTLTGDETSSYTTENSFLLDVSSENLILAYSQDGGGLSAKGFLTIKWHKEAP